jgi:hypothetical protein
MKIEIWTSRMVTKSPLLSPLATGIKNPIQVMKTNIKEGKKVLRTKEFIILSK